MGITYEQVQGAVKAIQAEGQQPTIRAIREHLGSGSLGTIHKYLHQPEPSPNPLQEEVGRLRLELDQLRRDVDRLNRALVRPAGHETEPGHESIHNTVTPPTTDIDAIIQQGYRDGLMHLAIAKQLNELGSLTATGKPWDSDRLRNYANRRELRPERHPGGNPGGV